MDKAADAIRRMFETLSVAGTRVEIISGTAVNVTDEMFDLDRGGDLPTIPEIKLKSSVGNGERGLLIVPKEGSHATVALTDGTIEGILISCTEIKKVQIKLNNRTFSIEESGISIVSGNDSLKGCLSDLIDSVAAIPYANVPQLMIIKTKIARILK
jgi:hypothetical protein